MSLSSVSSTHSNEQRGGIRVPPVPDLMDYPLVTPLSIPRALTLPPWTHALSDLHLQPSISVQQVNSTSVNLLRMQQTERILRSGQNKKTAPMYHHLLVANATVRSTAKTYAKIATVIVLTERSKVNQNKNYQLAPAVLDRKSVV